jgi:hypothetical protein
MIFFCTCDLHFKLQNFKLVSTKNQPMDLLTSFPCNPKDRIMLPSKFSYGLLCNQMHSMNMAKLRCKQYLSIKEN